MFTSLTLPRDPRPQKSSAGPPVRDGYESFWPLFEWSIFDLDSEPPLSAFFGDFGIQKEVAMVKNLLKMEQNSQKIAKMSENAKVHLDLCFAYPNGSPHDPESTQIGRRGAKIHENMLKRCMRKKVTAKSCFSLIFGPFWGPRMTPKTIKMGDTDWLFVKKSMIVIDFSIFWCFFYNFGDVGTHNEAKMVPNPENHHFCLPFLHFSRKIRFSVGGCASRHVLWRTLSTWKPNFSGKVQEGCAKIKPRIDFFSKTPLKTYTGAQSTNITILLFSSSPRRDAGSPRVLRRFEKVIFHDFVQSPEKCKT